MYTVLHSFNMKSNVCHILVLVFKINSFFSPFLQKKNCSFKIVSFVSILLESFLVS